MSRCKELLLAIFVCIGIGAMAQGLPPGWEYTVTSVNHTISIPNAPIINGQPISVGDYIGVFFINDEGGETCGGAIEYPGGPTAISAFGDDNLSPEKDGFDYGEDFIFRVYDWCAEYEYTNVTAINGSGITGLQWVPDGLTSLQALFGSGSVFYEVSGNISSLGSPMEGVSVTFSGGVNPAVTDADGNYSRCVPDGWTGDIIPVATGYTFDPESVALTSVSAATSSVDFNAYPIITISGTITEGSTTLSGVEVVFSNGAGTVYTNSSGVYTNTVEYGWTGTVTPAMTGKTFSPELRTYTAINQDYLTENYTASPATYTITGTVTDGTLPIENVEIQATSHSSVYTGADGQYSITVEYGWTGTLVPFKAGYNFTPQQYSVPAVSGNLSSKNFTGSVIGYYISGTILDDQQQPVQGVSVQFTGDPGTVTTNAAGEYSIEVPYGYSGTATPQLAGYTFIPLQRTYSDVTAPAEDEDYTGTLQTFSISGTITEGGSPLEGVAVTFSNGGGTVLTDAAGNYTNTLPYGWLGTSTPDKAGKVFSPASRSYTPLSSDKTNQYFYASTAMYEISGFVHDGNGNPIQNVELQVTGQSAVYSDAQGLYETEVEYGWTGTIQPQKPGYTFVPGIRNFVNINSAQQNEDFEGAVIVLSISGTILDTEGQPVQGVNMVFSNGGGSTVTDISGEYTMSLDYGYSGVATPSLLGYSFQPDHKTYANLILNLTSENYTATGQNVSVSGYITDSETGDPIEDVIVFFNNGGGTDTTNYEGYYVMELPYGWSGTVYPDMDGYSFEPATRSYSEVTSSLSNQNYSGILTFIPQGWNVIPTDISHNLSIPNFSHPSINGGQISIGDYIGVFYWDETTQTERCGGYVEWTGNGAITAFGNDGSTPEKDGFYENEIFRWRIHDKSSSTDYEAIAGYHAVSPYTFDGKYHTNALSQVLNLNADDLKVEVWPKETTLCSGSNVILSASPDGGSGRYSFSWSSIPPGFSSTQTQIIVSPNETTIYRCDVSTFLSNVSDNATVTVLQQPIAPESIGSDRTGFCADDPGTISITAVGGSGDILRWFSGTTELGTGNPLVVDSPQETTTYCARWENDCGVSLCTEGVVNVLPLPEPPESVVSSSDMVCINDPGTITLDYTGGSGDVLNWYANGSFIGSGPALEVESPVVQTIYSAHWENSCGTSSDVSLVVSILPLPEAPEIMATTPSEVCADDTGVIVLSAEGGSGDELKWFHNDAYFATGTPTVILSPEETSTYCARWENLCGVSECTPVTVTVLPLAVAPDLVFASVSDVCVNDPDAMTLSSVGGSGDVIRWFANGVEIGTGEILEVETPEVTTTYCARWENSCGVSECVSCTVSVLPLPEQPSEVDVSDDEVCINDPDQITLTATGGSGDILKWFANGLFIGSENPLLVDSPEVFTTYCAQWENSCGISNCVEVDVSVIPLPEPPAAVIASASEVCIDDPAQIELNATGGSGETLVWYVDGVMVGTGSPLYVDSPVQQTTYCARWENECDESSCVSVTVDVIPLPVAPEQAVSSANQVCIDDPGQIVLNALGGSGDEVYWYVGENLLGAGSSVTIDSPTETTTYCARWENSCGISDCATVTVEVIPLAEPPVNVTVNPSEVCVSDQGTINLFAEGGSGDVLNWYSGGDYIGSGNPLIIDSPIETTTFCASWENVCNTSSCVSATLVVIEEPIAPDSLTSDRNGFCPQDDGQIVLTAHGGSGDMITWFEGDCQTNVIATGNPITIPSPEDTTTYFAAWENLCGFSQCQQVTVNVVDTCFSVHVIDIAAGWSGLSSWVVPEDDTTTHIFAPIYDDLIILKNLTDVYWPPYANNLPYWNTWDGYKIKVENPCQLTFTGDAPEDLSVSLGQGWSLIPVLSSEAVTSTSVFEPLGDNLIIAKGVASPEVYWPAAGFYSLHALQPGKAYMVALDEPAAISYENATPAAKQARSEAIPGPWNKLSPTATSHIIALPDIATFLFNNGDIIGVFNSNGLCFGYTEIDKQQNIQALTVYGDDPTTNVTDGMIENEQMHFRVWSASTNMETSLQAEFDENYPARQWFISNGLGAVKAFSEMTGITENTSLSVSLFPVPAKDKLFVEVSVKGMYDVEIYTLTGKQLLSKENCKETTEITTDNLLPGLYMIRINSESGTVVRRFVVGQ